MKGNLKGIGGADSSLEGLDVCGTSCQSKWSKGIQLQYLKDTWTSTSIGKVWKDMGQPSGTNSVGMD